MDALSIVEPRRTTIFGLVSASLRSFFSVSTRLGVVATKICGFSPSRVAMRRLAQAVIPTSSGMLRQAANSSATA